MCLRWWASSLSGWVSFGASPNPFGRQRLSAVQYIATQGAKAVHFFTDHSVNHVALANSFDSILQASVIKSVLF